jgi:hypothetical protein
MQRKEADAMRIYRRNRIGAFMTCCRCLRGQPEPAGSSARCTPRKITGGLAVLIANRQVAVANSLPKVSSP